MPDAFLPFPVKAAAAANGGSDFRAKIVPGSNASHFTPIAKPSTPQPSAPAHSHASSEPKVTLTRDGDRITQIRIECTCGEVMDLKCVY